jgi:hypothetical protein
MPQHRDSFMKYPIKKLLLAILIASACAHTCFAEEQPDPGLQVIIIRHGEKPEDGENLTCQGENRARQAPAVLRGKFGKIDYIYVPTVVSAGNRTLHSRMFQTAAPVAIRNGLEINSQFSGTDFTQVAHSVWGKKGTVLLVWNHTAIGKLAQSLGVQAPAWDDADFDSILVIKYPQGKAVLTMDAERIFPSPECADR